MLTTLSEMLPGDCGVIEHYLREGADEWRLMELGLVPGTHVRFVRRAPLGDPLEVEVRGYRLSLRHSEAGSIGVRPHAC